MSRQKVHPWENTLKTPPGPLVRRNDKDLPFSVALGILMVCIPYSSFAFADYE